MIDPNELFYPAVDLLCKLIATPSPSREESATADLIAEYLQEYGFTPQRAANNVWAIAPGFVPGRPTLLLNSHHDTVKPVDGWHGEAFTPREDGDRLYGLGSNDAGASLVSLLQAFIVLASRKEPYNLIFLASAEPTGWHWPSKSYLPSPSALSASRPACARPSERRASWSSTAP